MTRYITEDHIKKNIRKTAVPPNRSATEAVRRPPSISRTRTSAFAPTFARESMSANMSMGKCLQQSNQATFVMHSIRQQRRKHKVKFRSDQVNNVDYIIATPKRNQKRKSHEQMWGEKGNFTQSCWGLWQNRPRTHCRQTQMRIHQHGLENEG